MEESLVDVLRTAENVLRAAQEDIATVRQGLERDRSWRESLDAAYAVSYNVETAIAGVTQHRLPEVHRRLRQATAKTAATAATLRERNH